MVNCVVMDNCDGQLCGQCLDIKFGVDTQKLPFIYIDYEAELGLKTVHGP